MIVRNRLSTWLAALVALAALLLLQLAQISDVHAQTGTARPLLDKPELPLHEAQDAEEWARQLADIPEYYSLYAVSLEDSGLNHIRYGGVWTMVFGSERSLADPDYRLSISAKTASLLYYAFASHEKAIRLHTPVDQEQALAVAEQTIAHWHPELIDQVRLHTSRLTSAGPNTSPQFQFEFVHLVNGIAYPDNSILVELDFTGKVIRYWLRWNDAVSFVTPDHLLESDQARQLLEAKLAPALQFSSTVAESTDRAPALGYRFPDVLLDAIIGETIGEQTVAQQIPAEAWIFAAEHPLAVGPPLHEPHALEQAEAELRVRQLLQLPEQAVLQLARRTVNYLTYSGNMWELEWLSPPESAEQQHIVFKVSIQASNGELLRFDRHTYLNWFTPYTETTPDLQQLIETAQSWVQRLLPEAAHQLAIYVPDLQPLPPSSDREIVGIPFRFHKIIHGVQVGAAEAVYVNVHRDTGELLGFSHTGGGLNYFAAKSPALSGEEAVQRWLEGHQLELVYRADEFQPFYMPSQPQARRPAQATIEPIAEQTTSARPVYRWVPRFSPDVQQQNLRIDAYTGQWRIVHGWQSADDQRQLDDLNGHPNELAVQYALNRGALEPINGLALPDQPITRGEALRLLLVAALEEASPFLTARSVLFTDVPYISPYFADVDRAQAYGLLRKSDGNLFHPQAEMTGEHWAEWLIEALGLGKLASLPALHPANTVEHSAAAAWAEALGLLPERIVRGEASLTRGEAAAAVIRFLQLRPHLIGNPL